MFDRKKHNKLIKKAKGIFDELSVNKNYGTHFCNTSYCNIKTVGVEPQPELTFYARKIIKFLGMKYDQHT